MSFLCLLNDIIGKAGSLREGTKGREYLLPEEPIILGRL